MLELINVAKIFRNGKGEQIPAVSELNLSVRENEFLCVVGASGCGKTTTLRLIAGLDKPTHGEILLDGKPIQGPGNERSVVFQRYTLFPWRTVLENISFGLELQHMGRRERRERSLCFLHLVGLADYAQAFPSQLSGGMQQRVAVARSLASNPKVLLMDEPFGALDARTRNTLQCELVKLWERDSKTVFFVTHSIAEAVALADRIVVMQSRPGRIKGVFDIDLPRPRDRHAPDFRKYHAMIHDMLGRG